MATRLSFGFHAYKLVYVILSHIALQRKDKVSNFISLDISRYSITIKIVYLFSPTEINSIHLYEK